MKCADFASPFCPCELAEHGQCLVCAQCSGKEMCDCGYTTGYCVMQELRNNGGKAMPLRLILKLFDFTDAAKIVMSAIAILLFIYLYCFGRYTEKHRR